MGHIEEVIVGQDRMICAAVVRVYTGKKRSKLICRPALKLYLIEKTDDSMENPEDNDT